MKLIDARQGFKCLWRRSEGQPGRVPCEALRMRVGIVSKAVFVQDPETSFPQVSESPHAGLPGGPKFSELSDTAIAFTEKSRLDRSSSRVPGTNDRQAARRGVLLCPRHGEIDFKRIDLKLCGDEL